MYESGTQFKVLPQVFIDEGQEWDEEEDVTSEINPEPTPKQLYAIFPKEVLTAVLSPTQRLVYAAIKAYYRPGFPTIPSISRIAADVGVVRRTVERAIKKLEECELLTRTQRRRSDGGITSNSYVLAEKPATAPCDKKSQPLRQDVAYPPDLNVVSPRFKCRIEEKKFKNKNNFKNYNTRARAKNATGDMSSDDDTPEQTDIEDFTQSNQDSEILQALQGLGKGTSWLQLLRSNGKYYIRPVSANAFQYITEQDFEKFRQFVAEKAGSCHGLKWGQYLDKEILI